MSAVLDDICRTMAALGPPPPPTTIVVWELAPERDAMQAQIEGCVYILVSRPTLAKLEAVARRDQPIASSSLLPGFVPLLGMPIVEFETLPEGVQGALYLGLFKLRGGAV